MHYHVNKSYRVCYIDSSWFFFERLDIAAYYKLAGVSLSHIELDKLYKSTEGWVAALNLQLLHYIEKGTFENSFGINKLAENEQAMLMSLSVFDSFTADQAGYMAGASKLPVYDEGLISRNTFIRFDPDTFLAL